MSARKEVNRLGVEVKIALCLDVEYTVGVSASGLAVG
jgi:hypothetical protein